jgi:hypothetical protein
VIHIDPLFGVVIGNSWTVAANRRRDSNASIANRGDCLFDRLSIRCCANAPASECRELSFRNIPELLLTNEIAVGSLNAARDDVAERLALLTSLPLRFAQYADTGAQTDVKSKLTPTDLTKFSGGRLGQFQPPLSPKMTCGVTSEPDHFVRD